MTYTNIRTYTKTFRKQNLITTYQQAQTFHV